MEQQTAVEWLEREITRRGPKENNPPQWLKELYEQAKEMEKQQIQDAYRISPNNEIWSNSGIDYYNETYKNK